MRKTNSKTENPKNNDIYNLKNYKITLDCGFTYYLLGILKAHDKDPLIEGLYKCIIEQINKQNKFDFYHFNEQGLKL